MLEKFFDHPGTQIKSYAKIVFLIEVVAFLVAGIICIFVRETILLGLSLIIGGIPASYITNLFLVAFGDLVETSAETKRINAQILEKLNIKPTASTLSVPVNASPTAPSVEKRPVASEAKQPSCNAVLSYALQFSTVEGMRQHIERRLKFCDNPTDVAVYQAILSNSDDNLRTAIDKYLHS